MAKSKKKFTVDDLAYNEIELIKYKHIIPSKGRWDLRLTTSYFPTSEMILVVPENEVDKYKEYNDNEIIAEPKWIDNLVKKRVWIMEHFGDYHIQFDDDIEEVRDGVLWSKIPGDQVLEILRLLGNIVNLFGVNFFATSLVSRKLHLSPQEPFLPIGFSDGVMLGFNKCQHYAKFIKDNFYYFKSHEDLLLSIIAVYFERHFLNIQNYYFKHKTYFTDGGISSNRSHAQEYEIIRLLIDSFGDRILTIKQMKQGNKIQERPFVRNIYSR